MIKVVSCGWNVDPTDMIVSVSAQKSKDWTVACFVDQKGLVVACPSEVKYSIGYGSPKPHNGAARNYWNLLQSIEPKHDTIVAMVDADDRVLPDAFQYVEDAYSDPNTMATYGSYRTRSGNKPGYNGAYVVGENVRRSKWRASHLKTFRASVIPYLQERYMRSTTGQWLNTCSDLAIMFQVLELVGLDRAKRIAAEIYEYNDESEYNEHKIRPLRQKSEESWVRRMPSLDAVKFD